jgi:hypothetical protein
VLLLVFAVVSATVAVDSLCYGAPTLAAWNFFKINLWEVSASTVMTKSANIGEETSCWQSKARLYGTHPWHWYFSQGLPAVLTSHLLLMVVGTWNVARGKYQPDGAAASAGDHLPEGHHWPSGNRGE